MKGSAVVEENTSGALNISAVTSSGSLPTFEMVTVSWYVSMMDTSPKSTVIVLYCALAQRMLTSPCSDVPLMVSPLPSDSVSFDGVSTMSVGTSPSVRRNVSRSPVPAWIVAIVAE